MPGRRPSMRPRRGSKFVRNVLDENEAVVDASNDVFLTFAASYESRTRMGPDEILVGMEYQLAKYAASDAAYAVAWFMDFSGSMWGESEAKAKQQFAQWIESLDLKKDEIYCAVIQFESTATRVSDGFVRLTKESAADLIRAVNELEAGGGTSMSGALDILREMEAELVANFASRPDEPPQRLEVHVTSDGQVFDGEKTLEGFRSAKREMRALRDQSRLEDGGDVGGPDAARRVFTGCDLHAYAINADDGAMAFFRQLVELVGGTLTLPDGRQEVIGNARQVDGSNYNNTLILEIPPEAHEDASLNLGALQSKLPKDFTVDEDSLTDVYCEIDLPKGERESGRTFTVPVLFNSTVDDPVEAFFFLQARVRTLRPVTTSQPRNGAAEALARNNELVLELRTSREVNKHQIKQRPARVRAILHREDAKTETEKQSKELDTDHSPRARVNAKVSLRQQKDPAEDDEEATRYAEVQTTIQLIDHALRQLDRDMTEFPNKDAAHLLYRTFVAIDTMQIPSDLAKVVSSRSFLDRLRPRPLFPFAIDRRQVPDSNRAKKSKTVRKGLLTMISRRIDALLSSDRDEPPDVDKLVDELVFRRSLRRRIKSIIRKREKCHCDADCACGGKDGGCLGDCGCAEANAAGNAQSSAGVVGVDIMPGIPEGSEEPEATSVEATA